MINSIRLFFLFSGLVAFAGSVLGDGTPQSRIKDRLPELFAAKDAGTLGEGADGLVHLRPSADDVAVALSKKENADRKVLFANAAEKTEGSVSAVAKQWAKFMQAKGRKGHWFRDAKGNWSQK
ncbi:MAG: DUF1318 domain-containing protein [Opitutales bacterium]